MEDKNKKILAYFRRLRVSGKLTDPSDLTELLELETDLDFTVNFPNQLVKKEARPSSISSLRKEIPKENPFIVKGLIVENAVTVIHGDTGSGKSLFTLKMVDDITNGSPFLNTFQTKKTNCLILDMEMTRDDCVVRAQTVCTDTNHSFILTETPFKISSKDDFEWLTSFISKHHIGLVIFDTLSKIHDTDENSNTHMTPIMQSLVTLSASSNIAVVVLHHVNKNKDNTGLSRGRGASSIADNAASYLSISSKKTTSAFGYPMIIMNVAQEKSRRVSTVKEFELSIIYNTGSKLTEFNYNGEVDKSSTKLTEARNEVVKFVQNNPGAPRKELTHYLDKTIPIRVIKDAIDALLLDDILIEKKLKGNIKALYIKTEIPDDEQQQMLSEAFGGDNES